MTCAKTAVIAAACALAAPARADFQLWSEAGASVEVVKRLELGFDQELRLDHGASEIDHVRPGVHASWRARKWLVLRLGYRYDIEPHYPVGGTYADGWHEVHAAATLRKKIDPVRVSLRLRIEEEWGRPWNEDGALVSSFGARQRLELEWPVWKAIALLGSGELFLKPGDPDGVLDEWRSVVGVSLGKGSHEVSIVYMRKDPFTVGAGIDNVLELAYHFSR